MEENHMRNLLVAQSGGPTAAINATVAGVVSCAVLSGKVDHIYGAVNGIEGVLAEKFLDLGKKLDSAEKISLLMQTPAAALGSCRYKLGDPKENTEDFEEILRIFRRHEIRYFIYIGGNDSMDTVNKLSKYCKENGVEDVFVVGAPKTIDNDLVGTDHCPGFGSAAKYLAATFAELERDCHVYEKKAVTIVEVMGRNAGYIALWCGIANGAEDILLPERYDGNEQYLINRIIENRKRGKKHHIIINAEGIGHSTSMARRIEAATGIETRATIIGHIQRGGTPTCKDRVYASIMGARAAELLAEGKSNRIVAYKDGKFVDFDIQEALNMKKDIPEEQ